MCLNYWNADACRQCGTVSNLVAPGRADLRTGLKNTRGSMCVKAQRRDVKRNRHTQHRDRPLQASNLARLRTRTLCGDYEPGLKGGERAAGKSPETIASEINDPRLTYLWKICSPECRRNRAVHVPQWPSPLKRCTGADAADDGGDEVAGDRGSGKSYVKSVSLAGRLKKEASLLDEVLLRNFRSDLESRGIVLVDDDAAGDENNAPGDGDASQDDEPPRKRMCAQLPSLEEEDKDDDGTF